MNVFILSSGRCGSTAFWRACEHITNFTAGHETLWRDFGDARFAYPPNHIESDNRLSWLLGRLDLAYGNNAFYVHLTRDAEDTARSFSKRRRGITRAYGNAIVPQGKKFDRYQVAEDMIWTVKTNIDMFLHNKTKKMEFKVEAAAVWFPVFWKRIGAKGDMAKGLAEFEAGHNPDHREPRLPAQAQPRPPISDDDEETQS